MHSQKQGSRIYKRSHPGCSIKKVLLKIFHKLTGKHLCWSLFLNKVAGLGLELYWKSNSSTGVFLVQNLCKIFKKPFYMFWHNTSSPGSSELQGQRGQKGHVLPSQLFSVMLMFSFFFLIRWWTVSLEKILDLFTGNFFNFKPSGVL